MFHNVFALQEFHGKVDVDIQKGTRLYTVKKFDLKRDDYDLYGVIGADTSQRGEKYLKLPGNLNEVAVSGHLRRFYVNYKNGCSYYSVNLNSDSLVSMQDEVKFVGIVMFQDKNFMTTDQTAIYCKGKYPNDGTYSFVLKPDTREASLINAVSIRDIRGDIYG